MSEATKNGIGQLSGVAEPAPESTSSPPVAQPATQATAPPWLQPLLVDLVELAVLLRVSARTVKRMAAAGELPGVVRLGRCVRFDRRAIGAGLPPAVRSLGDVAAVGDRRAVPAFASGTHGRLRWESV